MSPPLEHDQPGSGAGGDLISRTVGSYRLTRLLGEGGMGSVYLGVHPDIKSEVAIKILHSYFVTDAEMVRRFIDEARAVNQVKHPGIVRIHDCAEQQDVGLFLVMELLEGFNLAEFVTEHGPMEVKAAVRIVRQVATALEAVHQEGIVHRDLKSSNIMLVADPDVTGGERAKVLDFGIAKLWEGTSKSRLETDPGLVMGSVGYMSPEQCLDFRDVDHRTDIYSLGAIAYELLCGRTPFPARTTSELARQHQEAQPEAPGAHLSGVSPALDDVVMKALSVEPSERYQSMSAFSDALQVALDSGAGVRRGPPARWRQKHRSSGRETSSTAEEISPPAWLSRRNKTILLVATLSVVVVDVVLFLTILREPRPATVAPSAQWQGEVPLPALVRPDQIAVPDARIHHLAVPDSTGGQAATDLLPTPDLADSAPSVDTPSVAREGNPPARLTSIRRKARRKKHRRRRRPARKRTRQRRAKPARIKEAPGNLPGKPSAKPGPGKQPKRGEKVLPYDDL